MHIQLERMIESYVAGTEIPEATPVGVNQFTLSLQGFTIHIGLFEERGMLLLHAGIALVPQAGRQALYSLLLQSNNLFSETGGLTLGVDPEESTVTLQVAWPVAGLDNAGFGALCDNFVLISAEWMKKLATFTPDSEDTNEHLEGRTSGSLPGSMV